MNKLDIECDKKIAVLNNARKYWIIYADKYSISFKDRIILIQKGNEDWYRCALRCLDKLKTSIKDGRIFIITDDNTIDADIKEYRNYIEEMELVSSDELDSLILLNQLMNYHNGILVLSSKKEYAHMLLDTKKYMNITDQELVSIGVLRIVKS